MDNTQFDISHVNSRSNVLTQVHHEKKVSTSGSNLETFGQVQVLAKWVLLRDACPALKWASSQSL